MSLNRWPWFAVLVACLSCGDDTPSGPDDFLPVFTNSWRNTNDSDHTLNLVSQDDFQRSGNITGTENLNFEESNLEGTFAGVRVTSLTIHRATGDKVFTGRLVLPTILLLVSGADSLVFYRPQ